MQHSHNTLCIHTRTHIVYRLRTDLLDEAVCSVGAEQQDGTTQRVPVPVELLRPHGGEQVGEHLADIAVHSLQRYVHSLAGRLVQEPLQAPNIWRSKGRRGRHEATVDEESESNPFTSFLAMITT